MQSSIALYLAAALLLVGAAEGAEPSGIDLQALPLPLAAQAVSMLESPVPQGSGEFRWTLRTSGLRRPLALRLPSPSSEGTSAGLVEGVALSELSADVGLGHGWDVAFGFSVQWAQSLADQGNTNDRSRAERVRGRDPRLGVGWARKYGAWSLRPFAQVHIPLGDDESFSGEPTTRTLLGISGELDAHFLRWTFEGAFLYRKPHRISSTTWGPQVLIGTGVFAPLFDEVEVGTQVVVLPVVSRQEGISSSRGGRLVPAEALAGFRYHLGAITCGVGFGLGLPLSRTSSIHAVQRHVRGPTTPVYRGFFDLSYEN